MILANVKFGRAGNQSKSELEDNVETYLGRLLHQGQMGSEYVFAWTDEVLTAFVQLVAPDAHALRHHSSYGKETLAELKKAFGRNPEWKILEDGNQEAVPTWRRAPFLYLFTHAFDDGPPVCRGYDRKPVPSYLIPLPYQERESVYFWQDNYRHHDSIWLGCGTLEIPAYRELADPNSDLAQHGRDLCQRIEKVTSIPTYYFLMRFWGRRKNEGNRKCPGCGRPWRTKHAGVKRADFWPFEFQCHKCRLISHRADCFDNERHAHIGEFRSTRKQGKK